MVLRMRGQEVGQAELHRRDGGERDVLVNPPELRAERCRGHAVADLPAGHVVRLADDETTKLRANRSG